MTYIKYFHFGSTSRGEDGDGNYRHWISHGDGGTGCGRVVAVALPLILWQWQQ